MSAQYDLRARSAILCTVSAVLHTGAIYGILCKDCFTKSTTARLKKDLANTLAKSYERPATQPEVVCKSCHATYPSRAFLRESELDVEGFEGIKVVEKVYRCPRCSAMIS